MDKNKAQVFPQPYPTVSCDVFNCCNRAARCIGRPDGPLNLCLNLCDSCLQSILASTREKAGEVPAIASPGDPPAQDPPSQYACPQCGEQFSSPQALAGHANKHNAGKRRSA